jgi:hypothetical protein
MDVNLLYTGRVSVELDIKHYIQLATILVNSCKLLAALKMCELLWRPRQVNEVTDTQIYNFVWNILFVIGSSSSFIALCIGRP